MNTMLLYFRQIQISRLHVLIIALCIGAIYWQVYDFDFLIGWDDQWFVTNNYTTSGFTLNNLYHIFADYYYGQYAPLNQLYYTTLYIFFGYNPGYYHLMSVLLHLTNSILVYIFIQHLNAEIFLKIGNQKNIAFVTALLFGILPINMEPVAWVAASKVELYALFYLLALITYLKYINSNKAYYFYWVLFLYALSFGAKEQAVTLPVCMLLLDYSEGKSFRNKLIWIEKIPVFILSVLFGFITIDSQQVDERDFYDIFQRLPLSFYTISEYATKCIIPVNLSYLYPFPFQKGENMPYWLYIHLIAIPLIPYLLKDILRAKWVIISCCFFLIHILLVSNLFSIARFSITADRYVYIASIGSCLLITNSFFYLKNKVKQRKNLRVLAFAYIIYLAAYAYLHLPTWSNTLALKSNIKEIILQREEHIKQRP
ncbi:hypothetical protein [Mucilaginibacter defluvii]|uniref:hypothetical protein n=1 Tax=Mucilaginibacter defluvii TaxID=1196019 RepID=UPI0031E5BA14